MDKKIYLCQVRIIEAIFKNSIKINAVKVIVTISVKVLLRRRMLRMMIRDPWKIDFQSQMRKTVRFIFFPF